MLNLWDFLIAAALISLVVFCLGLIGGMMIGKYFRK